MTFSFPSHADTGDFVYGHNNIDGDGNPAGGTATSTGVSILWQDGPVNRATGQEPNGAFVEDLLEVCVRRLVFYQDSTFECRENAAAIANIQRAIGCLTQRREDRKARGVEGKHEI